MAGSTDLGDALRVCREAAGGMSQRQLAEAAGVSLPTIRAVEQGIRGLSTEYYHRLVTVFEQKSIDSTALSRFAVAYRRSVGEDEVGGVSSTASRGDDRRLEQIVQSDEQWMRICQVVEAVHRAALDRDRNEGQRFIRFILSVYLVMREGIRPAESVWNLVPEMRVVLRAFPADVEGFSDWCRGITMWPYRGALVSAVAAWQDPTQLPAILQFAAAPLRVPAGAVLQALEVNSTHDSDA